MTDVRKDPLYIDICHFNIDQTLDEKPSAYGFTERLMRENGWSRAFSERAIAEYKRFLYLCATQEVPMTPSDQVDQVWHLHLTYTRSYWLRLCGEVLPKPLHHCPSRGGAREGRKYRAWYERTLARYAHVFGIEAPADIWPAVDIRFGAATRCRRVQTSRYWLVLKPWSHRRSVANVAWIGLVALTSALIGCTSSGAEDFALKAINFFAIMALCFITPPLVFWCLALLYPEHRSTDNRGSKTQGRNRDGSCGGGTDNGEDGDGGDGCGCGCGCG